MKLRIVAYIVAVYVPVCFGQANDEIFSGVNFSFVPPGARSLAMGSAFAGRADDATVAYTNPAGLRWLTQPEFAIELRSRQFETRIADGSSFSGTVTGNGIDLGNGLRTYGADTAGLGYLSYVRPFNRWSIGLYRHQLADFEVDIPSAQGAFYDDPDRVSGRTRSPTFVGNLDMLTVNYGVSLAYEVTSNLWLGGGLSYYDFELDQRSHIYGLNEGSFLPSTVDAENESVRRSSFGDDEHVAFTASFLWKSDDNSWSLGAAYREGPEFSYQTTFEPGLRDIAISTADTLMRLRKVLSGKVDFKVPDVYTMGLSYQPTDRLTFLLDYSRVEYSDLEPTKNVLASIDIVAIPMAFLEGLRADALFSRADELTIELLENFRIDDADEVHFGFEYIVPLKGDKVLALRGGAWFDPQHQLVYGAPLEGAGCGGTGEPTPICGQIRSRQRQIQARFTEGDNETHITAGMGLSLGQGWTFDFGLDISDRNDVYSTSAIYRF